MSGASGDVMWNPLELILSQQKPIAGGMAARQIGSVQGRLGTIKPE